jgi:hypothetical protein
MKLRKMRRRANQKRGFGYGKRCPEYFRGCIVCEAYHYYDQHKRWPTFDEASEICRTHILEDCYESKDWTVS